MKKSVQLKIVAFQNKPSDYLLDTADTHEGIPVMKLKGVYESIDMYKKLVAVTVLANTIIAIIGFVYL